jgi:nicotinamidase-related amidase
MTLKEVLRSGGIKHLVMAGVATSSVILSTFTLGADEDYSITILSDACADPKASLHEELMTNLFPRSGDGSYRRSMDCFASGKGIAEAVPPRSRRQG